MDQLLRATTIQSGANAAQARWRNSRSAILPPRLANALAVLNRERSTQNPIVRTATMHRPRSRNIRRSLK
jgi:hypothetical protein